MNNKKEEEGKAGGHRFPDLMLYYKDIVRKTMLHQPQHGYKLNETEEKAKMSHIYCQMVFDNGTKNLE